MDNARKWLASLENSPLAQRWRSLPPRDRLALVLLGGFLLLVLLYLSVWRPVERNAAEARQYYEQERELYAYLQANAERARGLSGEVQERVDANRLQGFVTRSAAERGLSIERLESQGPGELQVSLPSVAFAELLRWFVELEAQGVRLQEVGLDRGEPGRVAARLVLTAGVE